MVRKLGRDFRRDLLAASMNSANRLREAGGVHVFQQVAGSTSTKSAEDFLVRVIRGQEDDACIRIPFAHRRRELHTIHGPHAQVDDRHVRRELLELDECRLSITRLTHDLEAVDCVQYCSQSLAEARMIVDEKYPDL